MLKQIPKLHHLLSGLRPLQNAEKMWRLVLYPVYQSHKTRPPHTACKDLDRPACNLETGKVVMLGIRNRVMGTVSWEPRNGAAYIHMHLLEAEQCKAEIYYLDTRNRMAYA